MTAKVDAGAARDDAATGANGLAGEAPASSPAGRDRGRAAAKEERGDQELVACLRVGDATALAALYDRHASAVHGLIRAILRDDRLAEESTHDVFLGLWQAPGGYDPARGSFLGWLLRVARNRAIDALRRHREQPFAATVAADTGQAIDPATWLVDPDPDPADQVASRLAGQDVRWGLTKLTAEHRRLLEMAYFGGMTQREIAAHLDRPLGTVKTQIRTAMQRLATVLTELQPNREASWRSAVDQQGSLDLASGGGVEQR